MNTVLQLANALTTMQNTTRMAGMDVKLPAKITVSYGTMLHLKRDYNHESYSVCSLDWDDKKGKNVMKIVGVVIEVAK